MADSLTPVINIRGNNNTTSSNDVNSASPSRLLVNTNSLRNDLFSRNLYTPNRIYPISDKTQAQNIINAIGSIASIIAPFKTYNLKDTVFGRLINPAEATPLTEISLALLGKQFAMNAGSHIAQQNFPTIKLANLFDGDKNTHLFTKAVNFKITKKEEPTNFQQFLNAVVFYNPDTDNPFKNPKKTNANSMPLGENPYIKNEFYIEKTGSGQITFLINAFNQNVYKEGFGSTPTDNALTVAAADASTKFYPRSNLIGDNKNQLNKYKKYYDFINNNPYSNIKIDVGASGNSPFQLANGNMIDAMNQDNKTPNIDETPDATQEYAPTASFIEKNFGVTNINNKKGNGYKLDQNTNANDWINGADEFGDDTINDKLVWGRDGIISNQNFDTQGTFGGAQDQVNSGSKKANLKKFGVYSGLLEYTRNLLIASQGNLIDTTRKAFLKDKNVIGFNGSALWVANDSKYIGDDAGMTGIRQHSVLDQYDRFAKTIRFNGNEVYGGNPNSVIYKTVLPRIHPTNDKGIPNNHNLMFSIENLAVRVISNDEGVGIIDDEYGSTIPICEVGQFNGRQMWFPPYNMEVFESTAAKFEPTVMVGRSEPMYSYQNSERSATLSFTLLVDYPPNLKNLEFQGADKHRAIAEFFAFGGDAYNPAPVIVDAQDKIKANNEHIKEITGPTNTAGPTAPGADFRLSFPNDFPNEGDVNTAIDKMYKTYQYEIEAGAREANGKISTAGGLNFKIYVVTGMTGDAEKQTLHLDLSKYGNVSQYSLTSDKSTLNKELIRIFGTVSNRHYYDIEIIGGASKLYTEQNPNDVKEEKDYNKALGLRRARATKFFVEQRIKALFGQMPDKIGINIIFAADGSTGSNLAKQSNATSEAINYPETRGERYATITIRRNGTVPAQKIPMLSPSDINTVGLLKKDIQALDKVSKKQNSNNVSQCVFKEKGMDTAAILKGFQSVEGNYYQPVFHSQTPEDFHRRLTFLQQCMRQGAAKRYNIVDEKGVLRAKNSVFGRQPICILRIGDFFFTKVVIENLNIDYAETTWDTNPEGFGVQPMIAKVTLQMKVIGGQSLKGPIDALQNAVTFNYYANSNFTKEGLYSRPSEEADRQEAYINEILVSENKALTDAYNNKQKAIKAIQSAMSQGLMPMLMGGTP